MIKNTTRNIIITIFEKYKNLKESLNIKSSSSFLITFNKMEIEKLTSIMKSESNSEIKNEIQNKILKMKSIVEKLEEEQKEEKFKNSREYGRGQNEELFEKINNSNPSLSCE
jgi:uncharacterized protein with PIN domain